MVVIIINIRVAATEEIILSVHIMFKFVWHHQQDTSSIHSDPSRGLKLLKLLKTPPPSLLPPDGKGKGLVDINLKLNPQNDGISACILCVWRWWKRPKQLLQKWGNIMVTTDVLLVEQELVSDSTHIRAACTNWDIRDTCHVGMLMETNLAPQTQLNHTP